MKIHEVEIEKIISNGCGLGRIDGKAVFIPYTIPGERAAIEILEEKKGYMNAKMRELLHASPFRTVPVCKYYYSCGGCTLQHMDYKRQLEERRNLIAEAVERNGKIAAPEIEIISGTPEEQYNYRCRAQFHRTSENKPGLKKRNGNEVIEIDFCPVCNTGINNFLKSSPLLEKERVTVFAPNDSFYYEKNQNPNYDSVIDSDGVIEVKIKDKIIKTDVGCFFQSNLMMLDKTIELITGFMEGNIYFDFYSGVGVFGLFLPENAELIVSIESDKRAIMYAKENIKTTKNIKKYFFGEKVEKFIDKWKGDIPDTVILDPPRTGISDSVKNYLADKKVKNIIYLSCDYATLGRDLGFFAKKGYCNEKLFFLDFYPQTTHAELLTILRYVG